MFAVTMLAFAVTTPQPATADAALNGAWVYERLNDVLVFDNGNWEMRHEGNRDMAGTYTAAAGTANGGTASGGTLTIVATAIHGYMHEWHASNLSSFFGIELRFSHDWYTKSDIRAIIIAAITAGEGWFSIWHPADLEAEIDAVFDNIFVNFTATYSIDGDTLVMTTSDWEMRFTREGSQPAKPVESGSGLNGIWVSDEFSDTLIFDNGRWELRYDDYTDSMGTYTVANGTLTLITTHIWHNEPGGWMWFLFGLELDLSRNWYSGSDIQSAAIAAIAEAYGPLSPEELAVLVHEISDILAEMLPTETIAYRVDGDTLHLTFDGGDTFTLRRER